MVLWILLRTLELRVRGFHPLWPVFPVPFPCPHVSRPQSEPRHARMAVWAFPVPLAATPGIDVSFFSSGYLDVSVHRVPLHALWIHARIHGVCPCGFPHSEIRGSLDICSSPRLFAAYHVFLRLSVPRHPPCALFSLTCSNCPAITTRVASQLHRISSTLCCIALQLLCLFLSFFEEFFILLSTLPSGSINLGCLFIVYLDLQYSVFKVRLV